MQIVADSQPNTMEISLTPISMNRYHKVGKKICFLVILGKSLSHSEVWGGTNILRSLDVVSSVQETILSCHMAGQKLKKLKKKAKNLSVNLTFQLLVVVKMLTSMSLKLSSEGSTLGVKGLPSVSNSVEAKLWFRLRRTQSNITASFNPFIACLHCFPKSEVLIHTPLLDNKNTLALSNDL